MSMQYPKLEYSKVLNVIEPKKFYGFPHIEVFVSYVDKYTNKIIYATRIEMYNLVDEGRLIIDYDEYKIEKIKRVEIIENPNNYEIKITTVNNKDVKIIINKEPEKMTLIAPGGYKSEWYDYNIILIKDGKKEELPIVSLDEPTAIVKIDIMK